jgi:hypothetical protein
MNAIKSMIAFLVLGIFIVSCATGEDLGYSFEDPLAPPMGEYWSTDGYPYQEDYLYYGEYMYPDESFHDPFGAYPDEFSQYFVGDEEAFYSNDRPANAETLIDQGAISLQFETQVPEGYGQTAYSQQMHGQQVSSGNSLWIVDATGWNRRLSLCMPMYRWAREEIVPATGGYLTVYERYPSGYIRSYYMGYVYPHHRYKLWFYADEPGTHEVWYKVGWQESNHIWFYVWGGWPWWYSSTGSSGGGIISGGGSTIVYGSGSTMISSSDGGISIKTSSTF